MRVYLRFYWFFIDRRSSLKVLFLITRLLLEACDKSSKWSWYHIVGIDTIWLDTAILTWGPWSTLWLYFPKGWQPPPIILLVEGVPLIISHTGVHETCATLPSTSSRIYDKEKHEQVKSTIFNKFVVGLNTFLFGPTRLKIGHKFCVHTYK